MEARFRKMAAKCSNNTTFLLLISFALLLDSNVVQGWGRLSEEEDLELDRQLQLINKPAIKSFQTENDEIVDCIDIYKQLAFDHPLLKNHAIQMKPKIIPKGMKDKGSRTNVFSAYMANISCPPGSVPIRRTTKEDLIMDKYQKSVRRNDPTNKSWRNSAIDLHGFHYAAMWLDSQSYGAKARINLWNLTVSADQYSRASMEIFNLTRGLRDGIAAGWEVRQSNYTRLYASWTAEGSRNSGCINVVCPGFVQVSSRFTLGIRIHPISAYRGPQYEIRISLYKDQGTGNWWFMLHDQYIGYWPQTLFYSLEAANGVSWGGEVYSPIAKLSPAMGSGHFPNEGYGKSAFVSAIKVITNNKTNAFVDPDSSAIEVDFDNPDCYNAYYKTSKDPQWGHYMFYGGPGKCTFN